MGKSRDQQCRAFGILRTKNDGYIEGGAKKGDAA